jgi:Rrf2 family protein
MNISVKGEYALEAIFDLTTQTAGQPVRIADIARRQKIPQKFLELILAGLKQGGFVESKRGAEGGYLLARSAETITVGAVLRSVEALRAPRSLGKRGGDSPFAEVWRKVDGAVSEILDHTTFAELSRAWSEKQAKFVPTWEI